MKSALDPSEEAQAIAEIRRAGEEKRGRLAPKSFEAAANEAALTAIEAGFGMKLVLAAIQHAQGTYGEARLAAMDRDSAYRLAVTTAAYETAFAHVLTGAEGAYRRAFADATGRGETKDGARLAAEAAYLAVNDAAVKAGEAAYAKAAERA